MDPSPLDFLRSLFLEKIPVVEHDLSCAPLGGHGRFDRANIMGAILDRVRIPSAAPHNRRRSAAMCGWQPSALPVGVRRSG